jgi:hypothetical protein
MSIPLPALESPSTPQLKDGIHEVTREHTGNTAACVENA